jgi:hypothetical protein
MICCTAGLYPPHIPSEPNPAACGHPDHDQDLTGGVICGENLPSSSASAAMAAVLAAAGPPPPSPIPLLPAEASDCRGFLLLGAPSGAAAAGRAALGAGRLRPGGSAKGLSSRKGGLGSWWGAAGAGALLK